MISKLIDKIVNTGAPIVVGLDPKLDFVPEDIKKRCFEEKGENLEGVAEAFWQFNKEIIDNIYDVVPAVKPQVAMYEEIGIPGLIAFKKTVDYCKEKGLIVIGDIKRGDIGSTAQSYAVGHLGGVKVGDKVFKGFDEEKLLSGNKFEIKKEKMGIFVLAKTSNPSSGEFQDRLIDGKPLYEIVGAKIREWGEESTDGSYSNVGAVVGATYPEMGKVLREIMPHNYILVPGYGAQGGKGKDLVNFFNKDGLGAIVNSSRGIIAAWKSDNYKQFGDGKVGEAARAAVLDMKADIAGALAQ